jgi:hypothetical protein
MNTDRYSLNINTISILVRMRLMHFFCIRQKKDVNEFVTYSCTGSQQFVGVVSKWGLTGCQGFLEP